MKWLCLLALLLGSCAAPTLTVYTLGVSGATTDTPSLADKPVVIVVARVTVPDELDTEDIVVRDGSTLRRSGLGRWASRLSLGVTDRVTERLAAHLPRALVTARPLAQTPSDRVLINISRLDVTSDGIATLDADWLVVPRDLAVETRRDRKHFIASGSAATDQDVVALVGVLVDKLAGAIEIPVAR